MIHSAKFIEFPAPFDPTERAFDPAPIFNKSFTIEKVPKKAELIARTQNILLTADIWE